MEARPGDTSRKVLALGVSGGIAGAMAKTLIAPLERLRLLAQTGHANPLGSMATLSAVIRNEGFRALWRGNTANVVRMVPSKCVLLACSDLYQDLFRHEHINAFTRGGLAGALAGGTATLCSYPLDLVRTRMAGVLITPGTPTRYHTILGTLVIIAREESVFGLFRGITPTLLGSFPYEGIKFGCYASLKHRGGEEWQQPAGKAVFGALAGTVANVLTYPNDVLRRRLQLQGCPDIKNGVVYNGYVDCCRKVVALEGWRALYAGLWLTVVRGIPNTGIQFGVYELCKKAFVYFDLLD